MPDDPVSKTPHDQTKGDLPGVLIYAPHLLPLAQHYVREHALRMRRHRPAFAGRRRVEGTPLPDLPVFTFGDGVAARLREYSYLLTGSNAGLTKYARRHNIKLIHAHFGVGGSEVMSLAATLNVPLFVTFHGWDVKLGAEASAPMSPYERLYRRRLPRLLQQASGVICVSENYRDRVLELGCPPEKVHSIYLGVDTEFFDGVRGDFDPLSILYVGRLIRRKGVNTLLESLGLLRDRGVKAHLTIVGEGAESESLKQTVADRQLPVRFLGKKMPAEVRELLRQAAVVCAPSTTAGNEGPEALGLIFIEAQAMRVPVVGTFNGGIPETMQDGHTGFLVEQDSPDALADALSKLLSNPDMNKSFGNAARNFVCDRFEINKGYRKLEDLYAEAEASRR